MGRLPHRAAAWGMRRARRVRPGLAGLRVRPLTVRRSAGRPLVAVPCLSAVPSLVAAGALTVRCRVRAMAPGARPLALFPRRAVSAVAGRVGVSALRPAACRRRGAPLRRTGRSGPAGVAGVATRRVAVRRTAAGRVPVRRTSVRFARAVRVAGVVRRAAPAVVMARPLAARAGAP